ncbi:MAG: TIGR00296 family protein [Candidatus Aenigmatarchaeota archaeon]|nr:MAG: TIGR00296 family protein [Candidatus Aenigmarchaeota archaeon]
MTPEEGDFAVRTARKAIEKWVRDEAKYNVDDYPESFGDKHGVFVTLHTYPEKQLRGCIGFPVPAMPLIDALIESAISVTHDPRFPRLKRTELPHVTVEVSILTKPEEIRPANPSEYPENIAIGKDGLMIKKDHKSGLLLPQVALEWNWTEEEFLMQTCVKAGLPPREWETGSCKIYKFRSNIFSENKPPY